MRLQLSSILLFSLVLGSIANAQTDGGTAKKSATRGKTPRSVLSVPAAIEVESDIVYKTAGDEKLALDLFRVNGRKYDQAPLVIWIHGGGYVKGDKAGAVKQNAELMVPLLMEHGHLVASVNYRFVNVKGPRLIDCMTDCMDAVRFLVKNSEKFGIDPARMVSIGSSAGGGLALMMALAQRGDLPGAPELASYSANTRAAVSFFGVTDFLKAKREASRSEEHFSALFDSAIEGDRQYEIVSPVWNMHRRTNKVPLLLVHGDGDVTVPFKQSVWMDAEAKRIDFPVEFVPVINMRHGFQPSADAAMTPTLTEIWNRTLEFILKNNADTYAVDLRDENIRIPPTVKPLFDQFMRDTYCMQGPDGWFYLTGTTPAPGRTNIWDWNDGLRLWRSKDLKDWEDMGLVFSLDRDGTWQKPFIEVPPGRVIHTGDICDGKQRIAWTPEIHYIKSKKTWLINACMGSKLDPRRGAFILRSISGKPEGPYENIEASKNGPINNLPGNFSADNSLFEDDDGTVYFVGVDHYVIRMKDDLSGFAEEPHPLIETPWPREYYCEGGYITKHDGRYHLVQTFWSRRTKPDRLEYSPPATKRAHDDESLYGYDAIVSSSDNIYGPYGPRYTAVVGGGHLNPFPDNQGKWWGAAFGNPNGAADEVNAFDGTTVFNCRPLIVPLKWENSRLMIDRAPR